MKKIFSILVACIMMFACVGTSYASEKVDNAAFTLAGYEIIDADAPTDEFVTRGEFAHIVAGLLGYDDEERAGAGNTRYWDVPQGYKYSADISLLTEIGVLNGVSENLFMPEEKVTYEQAIKVLVSITGSGDIATSYGGWPDGYITAASRNKMLGGVRLENPFGRNDLYRLVYNTLDVKLVDEVITGKDNGTLVKTEDTLRNKLASRIGEEHYLHKGVIVASSYTYTGTPYSDLYDDEVVIENRTIGGTYIYNIGKTNAADFVGCEVDFYSKKENGTNILLAVKKTTTQEEIVVNAEDLNAKVGNNISYVNEAGKNEKISLDSNVKVVYNGSRVLSPGDNIFEIEDGYVSFIDNDSDLNYDLAMIWEYKNAVAVDFDGVRFNFKNDALYEGATSLFVDPENDDMKMIVCDKDGNKVESFNNEHTVSIFADRDGTRYKIVVSDEQMTGTFEGYGDDIYTVSGKDYTKAASLGNTVVLGEPYLIYLDYEGKLAFAKPQEELNYGYIIEYGRDYGFQGKVRARIVLPKTVDSGIQTNEEDVTDTSTAKYLILQNENVTEFSFADKVVCQREKYSGNELLQLLESPGMNVVSFTLNENGEISEIVPLESCGGDINSRYQYNVDEQVFGGTAVDQQSGFAISSSTKAVCIPVDDKNNVLVNASDDDFDVKVHITKANNKIGYRVAGYDYDPDTKRARFLVTYASMDSTLAPEPDTFSTNRGMVTEVRYRLNEETDEYEQIITLLKGSEELTLKPIKITSDNHSIKNIKKGDLIVYNTNTNDMIQNVFIVQSIPKLKNEFVSESNSLKRTYGRTGNIVYDEVDTYNYRFVTKIEVYVGDAVSPRTVSIPQTNSPYVYIYDQASGEIKSATLRDIRPDGEKVFLFERKGDSLVRVIVLVR